MRSAVLFKFIASEFFEAARTWMLRTGSQPICTTEAKHAHITAASWETAGARRIAVVPNLYLVPGLQPSSTRQLHNFYPIRLTLVMVLSTFRNSRHERTQAWLVACHSCR